jgi:hypothetical protein
MSAKIPPPRQASTYPTFVVLAVGVGLPYVLHGGFQLRLAMLVARVIRIGDRAS